MGSDLVVQVYAPDRATVQPVVERGFAAVERLDERWSLYRPESELSRLNEEAGSGRPVEVQPDLWSLLETSFEVHRLTGGAFDVTVGPLVRLWGFLGGRPAWPGEEELDACRSRVGMKHVVRESLPRRLHFRRPEMEIDLGAIAKGYVVDRMALLLRDAGLERFLVDFGGSSQYAAGAPPGQEGWYLYVRPTWDDRVPLRRVVARDLSLSTSSNDQRFWMHDGRLYGHVLDPRTGRPTSSRGSVSVLGPSATMSDALATAFLVMGFDEAVGHLKRQPEWGAVFYDPDAGWREEGAVPAIPKETAP